MRSYRAYPKLKEEEYDEIFDHQELTMSNAQYISLTSQRIMNLMLKLFLISK